MSEAPPEWIGRELGTRYRIDDRLGEGGIGMVFRALDRKTNSQVALKVLRESFAQTRLQRRFAREAKALAALRHPNIVSILDVDVAEDTPFLVMELLEGQTLGDLMLATRPLPVDRAVTIMRELLEALTYVHSQGLVHRDLKPGNIFLQRMPEGPARVKLLDFGLAKFLEGDAAIEQATVTRSGDIFGTLGYMPPEQAVGDTTDARADVYSAGAVFFEMLAGRRPFIGEGTDLLQRQLTGEPPSLMEACPERIASVELEVFLKRAMASRASERYPDAAALLQAFDALPQPAVRAPTFEELEALAIAPPQPAVPIGLAPTILSESVDRVRRITALGPVARFVENVKELGRGILVAGAWVLSAIVTFLVLIAVAVIYILFGSEHDQQQQALRDAMPSTIRNVLPDGSNADDPGQAVTPVAKSAGALPSAKTNISNKPAAASAPSPAAVTSAVAPASAPSVAPAPIVAPAPVVAAPAVSTLSVNAEEGAGPIIEAPSTARAPAQNPWRGSIPSTLKKLRTHAQKGWRGDERAISWLRRYNREEPNDPRGHLVLAIIFMNREWFSDAAAQYAFAAQRDPSCRGDAAMQRNLIKIASFEPTFERGAGLLLGIYGAEAIPAVERAIVAASDPLVSARLQQLRARLSS